VQYVAPSGEVFQSTMKYHLSIIGKKNDHIIKKILKAVVDAEKEVNGILQSRKAPVKKVKKLSKISVTYL
jgi:hypothetical protein